MQTLVKNLNWTKRAKSHYLEYIRDIEYIKSLVFSFLLIAIALVANYYAAVYTVEKASSPVTDLILSNIRVYDVDFVFIYGPLILTILIAIRVLAKPNEIPFVIKSTALFTFIRSFFVIFTHIGPYPGRLVMPSTSMINDFTLGSDLFFSGHTGMPFLLALIFWEYKNLRYLLIFTSVLFGAVVLMGHLHYSIDVFSAFFITYTIYHIACYLFKKDLKLFHKNKTV